MLSIWDNHPTVVLESLFGIHNYFCQNKQLHPLIIEPEAWVGYGMLCRRCEVWEWCSRILGYTALIPPLPGPLYSATWVRADWTRLINFNLCKLSTKIRWKKLQNFCCWSLCFQLFMRILQGSRKFPSQILHCVDFCVRNFWQILADWSWQIITSDTWHLACCSQSQATTFRFIVLPCSASSRLI